MVLPTTNVVNVSNEIECGETFRVFNLNSLITTGDRFIELSLINVILALFSDDPHPITNPIIQCTKKRHYFYMNEKQNNKASIIKDMW